MDCTKRANTSSRPWKRPSEPTAAERTRGLGSLAFRTLPDHTKQRRRGFLGVSPDQIRNYGNESVIIVPFFLTELQSVEQLR
jgi:hypothetical protein